MRPDSLAASRMASARKLHKSDVERRPPGKEDYLAAPEVLTGGWLEDESGSPSKKRRGTDAQRHSFHNEKVVESRQEAMKTIIESQMEAEFQNSFAKIMYRKDTGSVAGGKGRKEGDARARLPRRSTQTGDIREALSSKNYVQ